MDLETYFDKLGPEGESPTYKQADASVAEPKPLTEALVLQYVVNKEATRKKILGDYRNLKGIVVAKEETKKKKA